MEEWDTGNHGETQQDMGKLKGSCRDYEHYALDTRYLRIMNYYSWFEVCELSTQALFTTY